MKEKMIEIAKKMIAVKSVNGTSGEKNIGVFLEEYLRNIPYFREHPDQVFVQKLKDDPLERRNVMALLIGEKEWSKDTLVFHGHTDTVGVEDYGSLEEYACNPQLLEEKLKEMQLPNEVRLDLESGDYMFGRGACDMKSGDAVFLGLIEELSQDAKKLKGNILVSFNPVEENLHTGMIEALELLEELKDKYGLVYRLAVNNDYICPLYAGDTVKTIYTGTVGKLLPCFYIQGKETHVGQCFEGFDASCVAAKLVDTISLNCDFCDGYEEEYTLPPSVLKVKDLKPWYNVQTAEEAFVYFNYFVHNADMLEITQKLLDAAQRVLDETCVKINGQLKRFSNLSRQQTVEYQYHAKTYSYEMLFEEAVRETEYSREEIKNLLEKIVRQEEEKKTDKREIPIQMIRKLLQLLNKKEPLIVLYYAAPYCPHNTLQQEDGHFIEEIQKIAEKVGKKYQEEYRMMKFFPSLSDSSYLKIDDTKESIDLLLHNFPGYEVLYPVPLSQIRRLNIPAINYGCYGKDAHKWTERVNIPYTFEVLPDLIMETIRYYLELEQ